MAGRIRVAPKEDRTADNIVFASKHEMQQYLYFKALERAGVFHDLKLQVPFDLVVNGRKVCRYIADFVCWDREGRQCIYDAKGMRTEVYRLKANLFHALHPDLRIVEV